MFLSIIFVLNDFLVKKLSLFINLFIVILIILPISFFYNFKSFILFLYIQYFELIIYSFFTELLYSLAFVGFLYIIIVVLKKAVMYFIKDLV